MARTFTGLKLQGNIGKFGNEELSDVSGYADLPDGKVHMLTISMLMAQMYMSEPCRCRTGVCMTVAHQSTSHAECLHTGRQATDSCMVLIHRCSVALRMAAC